MIMFCGTLTAGGDKDYYEARCIPRLSESSSTLETFVSSSISALVSSQVAVVPVFITTLRVDASRLVKEICKRLRGRKCCSILSLSCSCWRRVFSLMTQPPIESSMISPATGIGAGF